MVFTACSHAPVLLALPEVLEYRGDVESVRKFLVKPVRNATDGTMGQDGVMKIPSCQPGTGHYAGRCHGHCLGPFFSAPLTWIEKLTLQRGRVRARARAGKRPTN